MKILIRSLLATLILAVICCGIYPLAVGGIGVLVFPVQALGSLVADRNGHVVGSRLIGQAFSKPEYFHGRPSAAGEKGYDAANSSGSNLGPTNQKFADTLQGGIDAVLKDNPTLKKGAVPTDLVTASASGLDPHVTPEGAYAQVDRVAKARGLDAGQLRELVASRVVGPQWGIFGEPVVNVLLLNMELDQRKGK